ncbi:hypothetical protein Ddye_014694 [Dipteronia dyeriana]|uniref:NB-ARC domain-containing protein n=1 Tax=Dipteronia dyeriana TaxID=168575 RepID=A0AAE0CLD8_9ROSI|nr:hypothetical protein Ddye_014694 [Dipteronia dyeriana]
MEKETDDDIGFQQQINELLVQIFPQRELSSGQSTELVMKIQDPVQSTHQVIAVVVGEGGSDKTTLARILYNKVDVKRQFINRAWVQVPSLFKGKDVLAELLKQINQTKLVALDKTLSEDELLLRLIKLLNGSRYLIVLEEVHTSQVCATLQKPLCSTFSHQFGGIIIITTRNASNLPPEAAYSTLDVPRLNNEESWKLFFNKVRVENLDVNFLTLLKEQILEICAGLPSTIVLPGGLLSTKEPSYD